MVDKLLYGHIFYADSIIFIISIFYRLYQYIFFLQQLNMPGSCFPYLDASHLLFTHSFLREKAERERDKLNKDC